MTVVKRVDEWRGISQAILTAAGTPNDIAEVVTDHLVSASLSGHDSHGVMRIPFYLDQIKRQIIVPDARPEIAQETATSALIDGQFGFGHVMAKVATEVTIAKAQQEGVAATGVVGHNHIGRLGEYSERAADEGVILIITVGGASPAMIPYGGRRGALDSNPLSIGCPAGSRPRFLLDFSCGTVATGKIHLAKAAGESLPPGCIVDKDGNPSTNPQDKFDGGAHIPFGGHKGSALAIAMALLASPLVGADRQPRVDGLVFGCFMLGVNVGLFRPRDEYEQAVDALLGKIKATPPAAGFDEVLAPGEPEWRTRQVRAREGISVADRTWAEIEEAAKSLGVELDDRLPAGSLGGASA